MNIQEVCNFINFFINKFTGQFYTIPELIEVIDRGQISLFEDLQPRYATSQRIKDALSPFKETMPFTTLISGVVTITDPDYLALGDIQIYYTAAGATRYAGIDVVNEDIRAGRLNSQVDPVTVTNPIAEQVGIKSWRLYPASAYNGDVTYLRRPVKPVFGYTIISGRVIVYDPNTSTQLEWLEQWHNAVCIKALASIGINIREGEVSQFAEAKSTANYMGVNML